MTYLTLAIVSLLCLPFAPSRPYGVVGLVLLFLAYPYWTLGIALAAGGAYLYVMRKYR